MTTADPLLLELASSRERLLEVVAGVRPELHLARGEAVHAALSRFIELPTLQRSCVILEDVLEHSIAELAELLAVSDSAAQAALHRGRARLHQLQATGPSDGREVLAPSTAPAS